jgi:hypothetical protein
MDIPKDPILFIKPRTALAGPGELSVSKAAQDDQLGARACYWQGCPGCIRGRGPGLRSWVSSDSFRAPHRKQG